MAFATSPKRADSGSKRVMKEKVVQIYERFFQVSVPCPYVYCVESIQASTSNCTSTIVVILTKLDGLDSFSRNTGNVFSTSESKHCGCKWLVVPFSVEQLETVFLGNGNLVVFSNRIDITIKFSMSRCYQRMWPLTMLHYKDLCVKKYKETS